ncbi:MAG: hypothetical protein VW060_04850, partial [Acidimicrobiaceae bacterium]
LRLGLRLWSSRFLRLSFRLRLCLVRVVRRCLVGWRRGRGIRLAVLLRVMLLRVVLLRVGLMLWRRFGGRTLLGFLRLVVVVRRLW